MTGRWEDLSAADREAARQLFAALDTARAIRAGADPSLEDREENDPVATDRRPSVSEVWTALTAGDPLPAAAAGVMSPEDLARMLERVSFAALPVLAAAATGDQPTAVRTGDGVRLTLSPSRAEPSQVYATIDLTDRSVTPRRLVVLSTDGATTDLVLPNPVDGVIQVLLEAGAPVLEALGDPDSRIYLV